MNLYGFCEDCGTYPGHSTYKHDGKGRLTERQWFQGNNLVRLDSYTYDGHGNTVNAWVYEFDPNGMAKQNGNLNLDGKDFSVKWTNGLPTTSYRYDSQGNWTEATTNRRSVFGASPKIDSVRYRRIEYY